MVARDARAGDQALHRDLVLNFKWQALSALPLSVGLYLLAPRIVALLFRGRDFEPAAAGLQLLSLGLVVMFLNLSSRYLLAALDRQRKYLRAVLTGLIVNVVLCVALVPSLGFLGACGAALGAEVAIWIACHHALGGQVHLSELAGAARKPLLAALGMGLLVYAFRGANTFALVALGGASYVGFLFLLRTFSEVEMRIFGNLGASFGLRGTALLRQAENRR
jgi:O-antigen/teichoic acid export membrane protein